LGVPVRPLAFVAAIAGADYVLWNRSAEGNHALLALVSGFALVPLLIALVWLVLLCSARLLLERSQRRADRAQARLTRQAHGAATMAGRWDEEREASAADASGSRPAGKLAA
jgi:fatty acid desaturase